MYFYFKFDLSGLLKMRQLYKSFEYGIKDIDSSKGIITGYFSAFNSKDSDGDIIFKGAYSKTIQERRAQIIKTQD